MGLASLLERRFGVRAAGSTVAREVSAGLVTFATLSYVLFVQPAVLSHPAAGMDAGGVLFATCVASALACVGMALWANHPIALAPAMGHNFFFVFAVCAGMGLPWQQALAANFLAGVAFLLLAATRLRERVMRAVPASLAAAIAAGIGLLIALVGLEWGGLVVAHPATYVTLGDLGSPVALLALFGLALTSVLVVRGVRGAVLVGILGTAAAGWAASVAWGLEPALVTFRGVVGAPPSPAGTAFQLDLAGLLGRGGLEVLSVVLVFFLLDLFDSVGTLLGLGRQGGLLVNGELPRARGAFLADALGTTAGALLGTSTVTSYVESSAGIAAGGRTGLVPLVVALCFLAGLVFTPLIEMIGAGVVVATGPEVVTRYPVIAPVLILIGAFMMAAVRDVEWRDPVRAIPAFLTIVMMQLTVSISEGIAFGFLSTSILALAAGRGREVSPWVHAFALVFLARYVFLV